MEVIPHQAVRKHPPAIPARNLSEDLEEPLPIVPKHERPLVPTRNDMKDTTSLLDPRRTHHQPSVSPEWATI